MESLLNDVRFAFRAIGRRPGFGVAVILTLGLGIGASTAIFSVVREVLLQPPPYQEPERLVNVHARLGGGEGEPSELRWSYPYFEDVRAHNVEGALEGMAAFAGWHFNLTGRAAPERLPVEMVSDEYFSVLGIRATHGRTFLPEEDETPGSHPVAVISHGLWQRLYGSDPDVLGQTLTLDNVPLTVVGVMPRGFRGLTERAEAWVPIMMAPELTFPRRLALRWAQWHDVVGRLRPGVGPAEARRVLNDILGRIHQETPPGEFLADLEIDPVRLQEDSVDPALRRALWILLAAVGLVLAIAAANVVSLLLVRAMDRQKETAVRLALGIPRARLVRLFVTESVVLGLIAGIVGLLVAWIGIRLMEVFNPVSAEVSSVQITREAGIRFEAVDLGLGVLLFNFLFALVVGSVVGFYPALRAARVDVTRWIKQGPAQGGGMGSTLQTLRRANPLRVLMVLQVAVSLVLLIGAGLMIRTLVQLYSVPLGFDPERVLTLRLSHPFSVEFDDTQVQVSNRMLESLRSLPGVDAVSFTNRLPLSVTGEESTLRISGESYDEDAVPTAQIHTVGPEYFQVLQIPILQGRAFESADDRDAPRVAIVNREAVDQLFGGHNPIGRQIRLGIGWEEGEYATVVGVAGNARYTTVEDEHHAAAFIPFTQNPYWSEILVLRTGTSPETVVPAVRRTIQEVDPQVPVYDVVPMSARIGRSVSRIRFSALLLGIFAGVAFFLTAVGIYGLVAYSVANRTREIGVRVALGAESRSIMRMIVVEGVALAAVGLGLGLATALFATRFLASFLYELGTRDPATFAAVTLALLLVALIATWLPARRALEVSPVEALRYE